MSVNVLVSLNVIKENYWHNTTGTQQKFVIVRTMMNRYDDVPRWNSWGPVNRVKLGNWLLSAIMEETGWFIPYCTYEGRKRETTCHPYT